MAQVRDIVGGDFIRSYQLCGDEEWHKVFKIQDHHDGSFYIAIEGFGHQIVSGDIVVEKMYR